MRTVARIIQEYGGLAAPRENIHCEIEPPSEGLMLLVIGYGFRGEEPYGYPIVTVYHYCHQHGEVCVDPYMEFELWPKWETRARAWFPLLFRTDIPPIARVASRRADGGRTWVVNHRELKDQRAIASLWDRNLEAQGFLEAFRRQSKGPSR